MTVFFGFRVKDMSQGPLFHFVLPFENRTGAQAQGLGSECGRQRVRAWLGSEGGFGFLANPFHLVLSKKDLASITPFLPTGWVWPPTLGLAWPALTSSVLGVPTPSESHRAELGELWAAGLTAASLEVLWP